MSQWNGNADFEYNPILNSQDGSVNYQFRVLQVLPGWPEEVICCKLQIHSILNPPQYKALSYCWGNVSKTYGIFCNDKLFAVTSNVRDALLQFRRLEEPILLWIDQICINQMNLQERSHQVSMMRLIYRKAQRTQVWLGVENKHTKRAFDLIPRLARISDELHASGMTLSRGLDHENLVRRYRLDSGNVQADICAFMALATHPWFERVWIVQEVVVSTSCEITQGGKTVSWEELHNAMTLVYDLRLSTDAALRGLKAVRIIQTPRNLFKNGTLPQLRRLAKAFRDARSTDPRDKLYALVGITKARIAATPSMLSYQCSVSDAFRMWTVVTLQREKSLDILSAVNLYKSYRSTIEYSWVPDWDSANDELASHGTAWPSEQFRVSNSSEMEIEFRNEFRILGVSGHLLERVEEVGLVMRRSSYPATSRFYVHAEALYDQKVFRSWETVARFHSHRKYEATGQRMREVYWQTLLFGYHGFKAEETGRVRADFDLFYADIRQPYVLAEWLGFHSSLCLWILYCAILNVLKVLRLYGQPRRGVGVSFSSRCQETGYRRMIRTEAGYVGLAVHAAEIGDHVCLFKSAHTPFLVRRTSDGLRLVGDAYIHGVMYGERWQPEKCETIWLH